MSFFEFPHTRTYDSDLGWLIKHVLENSNSITNLETAVAELTANLPEEVQEQLQELIDDGTFAVIIQQLLTGVMPVYDSVTALAADTVLAAGRYAMTAGYYSRDDGGAGMYYISDDTSLTADGGKYVQASNGIAVLLHGFEISAKQYGCVGDGVTDDYIQLNAAFQYVMNNHKRLLIPYGTYMTSEMLLGYEQDNFSIIGVGMPVIKFIYRADRGSAHSVIGMEGCHEYEIGCIEVDASDVLGINGLGANGRNNTDLLLTNVHYHDIIVRNARISDTDLGGHAFTLQYNIGRALVENLTVHDSDIALDVTGVTAAYSLTTGSYASGVLIDGLNAYNCETVMTSYDLQTNVSIIRKFNLITLQNVYAYHCGLSKYATQPNNHLNEGAAGDGTDGGVFEFIGATRNITIRDALIDNTDWIKIGGLVRGKGDYCTLENVTFLGDAVAVYNNTGPYNTLPVNIAAGGAYFGYSDFMRIDCRVTGEFDYAVKLVALPDVADPYRLRYADIVIRCESVGTVFGAFSNIQWALATACRARIVKTNAQIEGNFYHLYSDFSTIANSDIFAGENKVIREANMTVSGTGTTRFFNLERLGDSRPSMFRMQTDGGATEFYGGITDVTKHCMRLRHNATLTGVEVDGGYNAGYIKIGTVFLWENAGRLYYKNGTPSSATDGTAI